MDKQQARGRAMAGWGRWIGWARSLREKKRVYLVLSAAARFALAAVFARARMLGGASPFAVAFAAACSGAGGGFAAVIGAFFGYLFLADGMQMLQYSAAALLCVTAAHVLRDSRLAKSAYLMPACAGGAVFLTGVVFLIAGGAGAGEVSLFLCQVVLCTGLTYFYGLALSGVGGARRLVGRLAVAGTLLLAFCDWTVAGVIAPARVAAVLLVMAMAYSAGFGRGAALGVGLGVMLDASYGSGAFFACTYGFSAMVAGVFNRGGRTLFVCVYAVANATASLLGLLDARYLPGLYESFVASVLFALIPDGVWLSLGFGGEESVPADYGQRARQLIHRKAGELSSALYEMYLALTCVPRRGEEDYTLVFDRAADRVCARCVLRHVCWEKEYITTRSVLNDVTGPMVRRGRAAAEDFPIHFSARCVKFPEFLLAVNEGLQTIRGRQQLNGRMEENRALIAQQYAGLTSVLRRLGAGIDQSPEFLPQLEKRVRRYAGAFGDVGACSVWRDGGGRLHLEITGGGVDAMMRQKRGFTAGLEALVETALLPPEQVCDQRGARLLLREKPPFQAAIGMGLRRKPGSAVSGDAATYFFTEEGRACLILSDGMGTGPMAAAEARAAMGMLERFLRAGIGAEEAVRIIGPALKIRSDGESLVTLDVAVIDLFTGQGQLLKIGAAPAYIQSGGQVRTVACHTLPAGAPGACRAELTPLPLKERDVLALVSDGVSDGQDDAWLRDMLAGAQLVDVKALAADLVLEAARRGGQDDMTCLVLRLEKS